jgi:hypothetical protein
MKWTEEQDNHMQCQDFPYVLSASKLTNDLTNFRIIYIQQNLINLINKAMNAMGHTIAGAASGETAITAAPKGSQSQAKGQKSIDIYLGCAAHA